MANSFFKFKQFTIFHDKCAMKVGTDGVLLGAWCDTDNCQRILDVGCGTGLISLMIAQRSPAHIDAIDIDSNACMQALENANRSPFAGQVASSSKMFSWSDGKIRQILPLDANKSLQSERRAGNGKVSVWRAVFRCLSGHFSELLKKGGLETIKS